jgi:hypothetical protein
MVDNKIVLARHIVGPAIVLMFMNPAFYADTSFWLAWVIVVLIVDGIAAVITGLAWLFFTKKEQGKAQQSFIASMWAVTFFELFGQWRG